jgi:hypothetical protein
MVEGRPFSILRASLQNQLEVLAMHPQVSVSYLDQLAIEKFNKALRKGMWRTIISWFSKRCNHLLSLDQDSLKGNKQGQQD